MKLINLLIPMFCIALFNNINITIDKTEIKEKGKLYLVSNGGVFKEEEPNFFYKDSITYLPTEKEISRRDYIFDGWYDNKYLLGNKIEYIENSSEDSLKFYAKWKVKDINIYFELDGGRIEFDYNYDLSNGVTKLPTKVLKTDYEFIGWYDNPYFEGEPILYVSNLKESKTFYAKYKSQVRRAIVLFLFMHGGELLNDKKYYCIPGYELVLPTSEEVYFKGNTFLGWYLDYEFKDGPYKTFNAPEGNVYYFFFARFEPNFHMIFYYLDGGKLGASDRRYYYYGESFDLPIPKKDGYKFKGWLTHYPNDYYITKIEPDMDYDMNLYAIWE